MSAKVEPTRAARWFIPVRALASAFAVSWLVAAAPAAALCLDPPGDVTGDGITNVVDVQCGINVTLWALAGAAPGGQPGCVSGADPIATVDANCDGAVTVSDVLILINYVLNQPLGLAVDSNQDGCPDSCDEPIELGSCCETGEGPGCDDSACATCVCAQDAGCCDALWDAACVALAEQPCFDACGCGEGPPQLGPCCTATEPLELVALASWTFEESAPNQAGPHAPEGGAFAAVAGVLGVHADAATVYSSPAGNGSAECFSSNRWAVGDYYEATVPTTGYGRVEVSWAQTRSNTGPAEFELRYSVDGGPFETALAYTVPAITWSSGSSNSGSLFGPVALPPAAADASALVIRLVATAPPAGTGGTNRIDDFEVRGALPGAQTCEDQGCVGCACAADPFCCTAWDAGCAEVAATQCAGACACEPPTIEPGDCCEIGAGPGCVGEVCESCVCDLDQFCCALQWDGLCVAVAEGDCFDACECGEGPPQPGDCCEPGLAAGCTDASCESCACELDDFCCELQWDADCVAIAEDECFLECECGDGPPQPGDCCEPGLAAGCTDASCESCACELDDFCCELQWDADCVAIAEDECFLECECGDGPPIEPGDCCETGEVGGCDDPECQDCVCVLDGACCDTLWDAGCVGLASQSCFGACGCGAGPIEPSSCCALGADPDLVTLAEWTFEVSEPTDGGPHAAEGGIFAAEAGMSGAHADATTVFSTPAGNGSARSFSSNRWTVGDYYEAALPTTGYGRVDVSWAQTRSGTGPAEFALQFSVDGGPFVTAFEYTVAANAWSAGSFSAGSVFGPVALPPAAADAVELRIRLVATAEPPASGGTNRIDDFVVRGALPSGIVCEDAACASCVCDADAFCCDSWDAQCAAIGGKQCATACGCGVEIPLGDCCELGAGPGCLGESCEACVCDLDVFCCDTIWDGLCVETAETDCFGDCGCGDGPLEPGDCCELGAGPGCQAEACEACVCDLDSTCCDTLWDGECVELAETACFGDCGCGEGPPPPGDCCAVGEGVGCVDAACESCVCALDDFCCVLQWDAQCVDRAEGECFEACECGEGPPVEPGDCCELGQGGGCDTTGCQACVCALDASCCDTLWDAGCVGLASQSCFAECGCGAGPIEPSTCCELGAELDLVTLAEWTFEASEPTDGGPHAAEGGIFAAEAGMSGAHADATTVFSTPAGNGSARSFSSNRWTVGDYYEAALPTTGYGRVDVSWAQTRSGTGPAEFALQFSVGGGPFVTAFEYTVAANAWSAGSFSAGSVFGPVALPPAAADAAELRIRLVATAEPPASGGTNRIDDFVVRGALPSGIVCEDAACASCVCDADAFCCDSWDAQCAAVGAQQCAGACGCVLTLPQGDCCEVTEAAGCTDAGCETCVCAADEFCCELGWDLFCVESAEEECFDACGCGDGPPLPGDCCEVTLAAGCTDAGCEACACALDEFCCVLGWDAICVGLAEEECFGDCGCGDGPIEPGDCCELGAGAGCVDAICEACVCGVDGFCCQTLWDGSCVDLAEGACFGDCACGEGPPPPGDCCEAGAGIGCIDAACEGCVCAADELCCVLQWDAACVGLAEGACFADCACGTGPIDSSPCCVEGAVLEFAILAEWTFEESVPTTAGPHATEAGLFAAEAALLASHADPTASYTNPVGNGSGESFNSNRWAEGDYYEASTPTLGSERVRLSWAQNRSGTGPAEFALTLSVDGGPFETLMNYEVPAVSWSSTTSNAGSIFGPIELPPAASDAAMVTIRLVATAPPGAATGTNRIDDVRFIGAPPAGGQCEDLVCADCVCAADPFCCSAWDEACAALGATTCFADCGCPAGD